MKRRTMAIVYSILIAALAVASASPALAANATPTYSNPLKPERGADPWVYKHTDGYYYYMTTAGGVSIWKSKTLSGLTSGEKTEVWTLPSAGPNSREMWAPELHYLEGKWYIYYTATDRRPNGHGGSAEAQNVRLGKRFSRPDERDVDRSRPSVRPR